MMTACDVAVVGAGVIGMATAWRLAQRGIGVTVVDPNAGGGATGTAAGMLAPVTELHYGEEALLRLNLASAERYAAFVAEVQAESGQPTGYRESGTLAVAYDGAEVRALRDLLALQHRLGLRAQWLTGAEVRDLEPAVSPGVPGGMLAADDHSVDPRLLHTALTAAARRRGVHVRTATVSTVLADPPRVHLGDGSVLSAGTVVVAAGVWSPQVLAALSGPTLPVRPVKGQTLRLRGTPGQPGRVVRGNVRGFSVYVVPRDGGDIVVGATSEEVGFDLRHRAGAVLDLLRHAQALLPDIGEAELVELSTSLRPGTPDNAPIIGRTAHPGIVVATGHYRNGILLAPVTADAVTALLTTDAIPDEAAPFGVDRFDAIVGHPS